MLYRLCLTAHDDSDVGKYDSDPSGDSGEEEDDEEGDEDEDGAVLVHSRQARTTLALLQTFHAQTRFLLSRLATCSRSRSAASTRASSSGLQRSVRGARARP